MCQVHTGAYVSLLAPGKTDYNTACHPRKLPRIYCTYVVVLITTHTHDRGKSISEKETKKRKEDKGKKIKDKKSKKSYEKKRKQGKEERKKKCHTSRP